MIEVHHQPDKALSDGAQSIYPQQFADMMGEVRQIARILHRDVPDGIRIEQEVAGLAVRVRTLQKPDSRPADDVAAPTKT